MQPEITFRSIKVLIDSEDHESCLVLADGKLVAILVRLDHPGYDSSLLGSWYLEFGFGAALEARHDLFASLEDAAVMIAANVKPFGRRLPV